MSFEHVKTLLKDYEDVVTVGIHAQTGQVTVHSVFVSKDKWQKIHDLIKSEGGTYHGGAGAHWTFPKEPKKSGEGLITQTKLVMEIMQHMVNAGNEMEMAKSKMDLLQEGLK